MADDPLSVNPMFNNWLQMQNQFLKAQEPYLKKLSEGFSSFDPDDRLKASETLWDESRKVFQDWLSGLREMFPEKGEGMDGIVQEVLQRMLDPSQFLYAGSDEVNKTIQKLVEGPEFSDLGTLERQGLKATREWVNLREAGAEYRMVTGQAWMRAFERFSEEMLGNRDLWKEGPRAVLNRWLETANDELIATQRTKGFLDAQRKLLRAGVDYRLRQRDMVEGWCDLNSVPTRTEVDDLHKTVYELRRDLRAVKKGLAQLEGAPQSQDTP